ncbi:Purine phosphoribosyltransferase [Acidilobus saccharovorans 345-15]|uniref:Purine phosphoribosyltransferase n=1 Tax=Acidilobus saccharovorans (strain DSM 16705 / JCM 18335 / VKM B-2471 / 345-15) TaxID=666510 RepID=D9Q081_ACIS3|nr:phosphoribosyltransferase family protein [Acidilobus saccharovorans]ADL18719.1 Purine phosphoribosyltransferase [Acidilobus saccharovorans 345-15]
MPTTRVKLLAALRDLAGGAQEVLVEGSSWTDVLKKLLSQYPGLSSVLSQDGTPRPGFLVFVDGVDSRLLDRSRQAKEIVVLPVNHGGDDRFQWITWSQIDEAVERIAEKINSSGFRPDAIVCIMRGGLIPGRLLADRLGVEDIGTLEVKLYISPGQRGERPFLRQPLTLPIKDKKVLLVDDVSDSGLTLQFSVQALSLYMPTEIRTAALYIKPWTKLVPDYYADQVSKWIVFPWEVSEFKREVNGQESSNT